MASEAFKKRCPWAVTAFMVEGRHDETFYYGSFQTAITRGIGRRVWGIRQGYVKRLRIWKW